MFDAFRCHLPCDHINRQTALMMLAACHRHRIIEQDFIGHMRFGCDRITNGQNTGMVIGAIAQILEDVVTGRKRRFPYPIGALAPHLGKALCGTVHPLRHVMAPDTRISPHALRHFGRGIMRTARAKMRHTATNLFNLQQMGLQLFEAGQTAMQVITVVIAQDPFTNGNGDIIGIKCAFHRKQPTTLLVFFSDTNRLVGTAVKLFAQLHFHQGPLFLDDDHQLQTFDKGFQAFGFKGPRTANFIKPDADLIGALFINAEII